MSMDDIFSLFDNSSFSVFNTVSEPGTALPYGVMFVTTPNNTAADDIVYCVNGAGRLELYTAYKDYNLCAEVENTFNQARIPWQHDTDYLSDQVCFLEIYTFGIPTGKLPALPDDPED